MESSVRKCEPLVRIASSPQHHQVICSQLPPAVVFWEVWQYPSPEKYQMVLRVQQGNSGRNCCSPNLAHPIFFPVQSLIRHTNRIQSVPQGNQQDHPGCYHEHYRCANCSHGWKERKPRSNSKSSNWFFSNRCVGQIITNLEKFKKWLKPVRPWPNCLTLYIHLPTTGCTFSNVSRETTCWNILWCIAVGSGPVKRFAIGPN